MANGSKSILASGNAPVIMRKKRKIPRERKKLARLANITDAGIASRIKAVFFKSSLLLTSEEEAFVKEREKNVQGKSPEKRNSG